MTFRILVLVVPLLAWSCIEKESDFFGFFGVDDEGPGQVFGDITGRVTADGEGLSGVTVSVTGPDSRTTTTDQDGNYAFADLPEGGYTVAVSPGPDVSCPGPQTASVPPDAVVNFECQRSTASVTGTVTSDGTPIEGASVTLSGPTTATAVTDASGTFRFDDVDPGNYAMTVSASGFTCQPQTTMVAPGQTSNVDIPCTAAAPTGTQIAGGYRLDGVGASNDCSFGFFPQPGEMVANPGPIEVRAEMEGGQTVIVIVSNTEMRGVLNGQTGEWTGTDRATLTPPLVLQETTSGGRWQFDASGTVVYDSDARLMFDVFDDAGTPDDPSDDSPICQAVVEDVQYTRIGDFVPSAARFKSDVRALLPRGMAPLGLRPVAFRYRPPYGDPEIPRVGLIAEEVLEVFPEAVALDAGERPWGIRYGVLTGLVIGEVATRIGLALEGGIERLANGR